MKSLELYEKIVNIVSDIESHLEDEDLDVQEDVLNELGVFVQDKLQQILKVVEDRLGQLYLDKEEAEAEDEDEEEEEELDDDEEVYPSRRNSKRR